MKMQVVEFVFRFTAKQEEAHAAVFYQHLKELSGKRFTLTAAIPWIFMNPFRAFCVRQST